jgi:hypothetical protein
VFRMRPVVAARNPARRSRYPLAQLSSRVPQPGRFDAGLLRPNREE